MEMLTEQPETNARYPAPAAWGSGSTAAALSMCLYSHQFTRTLEFKCPQFLLVFVMDEGKECN